jgi:type II secretory pathway pseudopilin PulG
MHRRAFTLVEILLVMAIVMVLTGILVPAVQKVRESANRMQTHSNLMQMVLAVQSSHQIHGKLPPATGWYAALAEPKRTTVGGIPATVHFHLLPFVEQQNVYQQAVAGQIVSARPAGGAGAAGAVLPPAAPIPAGNDKTAIDEIAVPVFCSALDPTLINNGAGLANFAANLRVFSDLGFETKWNAAITPGAGGVNPKTGLPWVYGSGTLPDSVPDGLSNTIAFTTRYASCGGGATFFFNAADVPANSPFFGFGAPKNPATPGPALDGEIFQVNPTAADCTPVYTPQSLSSGGLSVALFDGSVRLLNSRISPQAWGLAVQPNDGMVLPTDWH